MTSFTLATPEVVALPALPKIFGVRITGCTVVKDGNEAHITYTLEMSSDLKLIKMAIAALNTKYRHKLDEERFELNITVTCTDGENYFKLARSLAITLFKPVQIHAVRQSRATSAPSETTLSKSDRSTTPRYRRPRHKPSKAAAHR